ncbi:MAG: Uma2 family endonuclease [Spirulinaceae cyanobacterium]
MTVTLAKWTIADYHHLVQTGLLDDRAVELLSGEIVEMPPEGEPHAYYSRTASDYLARLLGDRALVSSAKPITLPNNSEPEPDIAIVERLGREYLQHHPYAANIFWVIEYSQASLTKDQTVKYRIYAEAGIAEYWLVNLARRELVVFRDPQGSEYGSKMTLKTGEIAAIAFPELAISVAQIIAP